MTAIRTIDADPVQHDPYTVVQTRVRRVRWRTPVGEPTALIVLLVIAAAVLTAVRCAEWASSAVRVPLPGGLIGSLERTAPEASSGRFGPGDSRSVQPGPGCDVRPGLTA